MRMSTATPSAPPSNVTPIVCLALATKAFGAYQAQV